MVLARTLDQPASKPIATSQSRIAGIYARWATDTRVMIAHGYGIRVGVWQGQLEVSDGIGRHRRIRKVPKADRELERLVITGHEGYVTLGAMRWCREHGVSITVLDSAGDLVATHVPEPRNAPKLLRTQALASPGSPLEVKGVEVARYLLQLKLAGQSANLVKVLGNVRASRRIDHFAGMLADATTFGELNELERWAANTYFTTWRGNVRVPWPASDRTLIPDNWLTYRARSTSTVNSSKRYAIDPVNAMLNYAYTIGYAEARIACIGNLLNPTLGFLHSDSDKRDSLALDLLEAIRPDIDAYVLGLLGYGSEPRVFTRKDFAEPRGYPHGTVRLVAPLTHEIAEQSVVWGDLLIKVARDVAGILGAPAGKRGIRLNSLAMQKTAFITRPVDVDQILPVEVWKERFCGMLPEEKTRPNGGYAPISSRSVLAAMIYLEQHKKPWAHVPPGFGVSQKTLINRRVEWRALGLWDDVWSVVLDLAARPVSLFFRLASYFTGFTFDACPFLMLILELDE